MSHNQQKLAETISRCNAVIFDFGGVLYDSSSDIQKKFCEAGARIGQRYVSALRNDFALAMTLCRRSYEECGLGTRVFAEMSNTDPQEVNNAFQVEVARTLRLKNSNLSEAFKGFMMPRALLTQSSKPMALCGLEQTGIREYFPDTCIYTSDMTPAPKAESPAAVCHVLDKQGWFAATTLMLDDSPINLFHAKAAGLKTALISGDEAPHFRSVDCVAQNAQEFLGIAACEWHPLMKDRPGTHGKSVFLSLQPQFC